MILDAPLLGKAYVDNHFLSSGMLYESDGRLLLELHNGEKGPEEDYLDQLDPSCLDRQSSGAIAISAPKMKPCPETISFFTGPREKSYLLSDCQIAHTDFTYGGGPYNFRRLIAVRRLIQLSDYALSHIGSKYLKINRMRSMIPALNKWWGDSSLFVWLPNNAKTNRDTIIAYGLKNAKPIKIGRISSENNFYARIQVCGDASDNLIRGQAPLHSYTVFSTYSHKHLDITEHLRIHQAFLVLLEIAYGCKLDMNDLQIARNDDKPFPSRSVAFRKLSTFEVPSLSHKEIRHAQKADPIFRFQDIGIKGIHKWFELLQTRPTGAYSFISLLENERYLPLETQVLLVGVAIEHIGAMSQKHDGNFHDQLSAILNQLLPLLSSEADRQLWIGRVVASYNGIKHFFRAKKRPDTLSMVEYLLESKQVIRLWIAYYVGCSINALKEYLTHHRYSLSYIRFVFK